MKQQIFLFIGLTVLLSHFCIVASAQSDDVEWLDAEEYTLYWGDEVNHSGYLITAEDFSPAKAFDVDTDYVLLSIDSIYGDSWGAILSNNTGGLSNNTIFDDRLNITAIEIVTGNDIPAPYTVLSVAISNSTESVPIVVKKIDATLEFDEEFSDEVYMGERAYYDLDIRHMQPGPIDSVTIRVELPDGLIFDPDSDGIWNHSFSSYGTKTLQYSVKALRPGTYEINGTLITAYMDGKSYSKEMNSSTLVVHGPDIIVSKTLNMDSINLNENVNVSVDVVNEGDRAAYISLSDQLPPGGKILSGGMGGSLVLHPDDTFSVEYALQMNKEGEIVIPSAVVKFVDSSEYSGTSYSKKFILPVLDPDVVMETSTGSEDIDDDYAYIEETVENDEFSQESQTFEEPEEDHGKLQFLYDILDMVTGFFKKH
ncbi:hypothetical protein RE474_12415 [Methanolobus sediminis]|uniref:DUF11 domain-containing protein n=1 Tax=Methanolobus sediminis TaxID=3072978 RepID=A0AA51UK34_9EURY|nr:hypothetical protein [Methanolobus sediminis]WMW24870.1 hypothetical protein RE474_12415 [Methanolobus sediminis]